ncbi:hypothetical protein D9M71_430430 [compost metagenome]
MLAGFDEGRVGLDRPRRLASGIALAEVQLQALHHAPRVGRQQYQFAGEEHGFFDVVGNQEHRFGGALPHLQQKLLHLFAGKGIEGAERFVHQQHPRVGRQRPGQAHALLLATGQLPDAPFAKAVEVDQGQHLAGLGFTLRSRYPGQFQAEGDVAQHVLPGQQGVVLEHHAALGAGALDRHAVQGDAPAAGGDEAGDQVEQRGLAAAGRPQGHQ